MDRLGHRRCRAGRPQSQRSIENLPHRSLGQAAPLWPLPPPSPTDFRKIQRHDRVGGLLHEYQQVA